MDFGIYNAQALGLPPLDRPKGGDEFELFDPEDADVAVVASNPATKRKVVVLPAPFGLAAIERSSRSTARRPKFLVQERGSGAGTAWAGMRGSRVARGAIHSGRRRLIRR
jgi:hypothetical protein